MAIVVGFSAFPHISELDENKISERYFIPVQQFSPEPNEIKMYICFCLVFFIVFYFLYLFRGKIAALLNCLPHSAADIVLPVAALTGCGFLVYTFISSHSILFVNTVLYKRPVYFLMLCCCLALLYVLVKRKIQSESFSVSLLCHFFAFIAICYIGYVSYVTKFDAEQNRVHYAAFYHPIFQTYHGSTIYYDTKTIYGLYAYFYSSILRIIGLSFQNVAMINSCLMIVCFCSIYYICTKLFESRVKSLLCFLSVIGSGFLLYQYATQVSYPQYYPLRLLCPAIMLAYIFFCEKKVYKVGSRNYLSAFGYFVLSPFSLLWNLDSGIPSVLAWLAYNIFQAAVSYDVRNYAFWKKCLFQILNVFISALVALVGLLLYTYLRCKHWIDVSQLFAAQGTFMNDGFFMIPVERNITSVWLLGWAILCLGFAVSIRSFKMFGETTRKNSAGIFAITVTGFGLLIYYMGRSHENVFVSCSWPIAILFSYFILHNLSAPETEAKKHTPIKTRIPCEFVQSIRSFVAFIPVILVVNQAVSAMPWLVSGTMKEYYSMKTLPNITTDEGGKLISEYTEGDVAYIGRYGSFYLTQANQKNNYSGPSVVDWMYISDIEDAYDFLDSYSGTLIFERSLVHTMLYFPDRYDEIFNKKFHQREVFSPEGELADFLSMDFIIYKPHNADIMP